jgi:polyphenol oxidase
MVFDKPGKLHLSEGLYLAPDLERFPWLEHGFGTPRSAEWPPPERTAMLKQIHSATIIAAADGSTCTIGEGDAIVTNRPGLLVAVRTADCVPILLADTENRAVAAIHAGWRGTAGSIVELTVREMECRFGTRARNIHAAIGPCIGACCYEVGPEVMAQFRRWLGQAAWDSKKLDLPEVNRHQLADAGVPENQISGEPPCTFCRTDGLHSYRRDGAHSGRMISAIGIR